MTSLKENEICGLKCLPEEEQWIFIVKSNSDSSIDKFKARLIIKGFNQRQGIGYNQKFMPVAILGTIRSILNIADIERMHLGQFAAF